MDQQVLRRQVQLQPDRPLRPSRVVHVLEQLPQPGPAEPPGLVPQRLDERGQIGQQRLAVELDRRLDEPRVPQADDHPGCVVGQRQLKQSADLGRHAVRQALHRAEVQHAEPAVVQQPEVARVRVCVQQAGAGRAGQQELQIPAGTEVTFGLAAVDDQSRQRHPLQPLADDHMRVGGDHLGDGEHRVAAERLGELSLGLRLQPVVELLDHPGLQLFQDRLDVQPGDPPGGHPGHPGHLVQVRDQRLAGPRVLHLHRHRPAVAPDAAMHLPDRGSRRRLVVELAEQLAPPRPQLGGQHPVHGRRRHRRGRVLQLGQRGAVRPGQLLGQRRLEDAHRLAELHRPALELAEHPEQLVGGAGLDLGSNQFGRPAPDPLPQPEGGAPGEAERQCCQLHGARDGTPR